MAIKFIVDSASDITPAEAKELGIIHVPMTVSFDEEEFLDSINLTHKEFYEKLIESDSLPKTSQISPAVFSDVFKQVIDAGDTPVAIVLSSALSGTYQSACIAASEFEGKAFVIDSLNVTIAERILVLRGLELAKEITDASVLVEKLNEEKLRIKILAVLDTLEYLKKGGRISSAVAFTGEVLSIKPVVTVEDGAVVLCGKARGSKKGNSMLRNMINAGNGVDFSKPYYLGFSGLSDVVLQKYIVDSADLWQAEANDLPVSSIGGVIGTHVGPGAIAVAFFEK